MFIVILIKMPLIKKICQKELKITNNPILKFRYNQKF